MNYFKRFTELLENLGKMQFEEGEGDVKLLKIKEAT